jgi:hypothetical protein
MKLVGLNVDTYILKRHPFNYINQANCVTVERIKSECKKADIIMVMHTCGTMWDIVKEMNKPIIVWHTGTRYRQGFEKHNARWNNLALKSVCVLPEFPKLGCSNPHYISMTVDTDVLIPDYSTAEKLRVGHYPSNAGVKGTSRVNLFVEKVSRVSNKKFVYNHSVVKVDFNRQLMRLKNCDIYIEMFAPEQDGFEYGSFGTTALETAALGKVVITNNMNADVYEKYYGACQLIIANTERDFKNSLAELLSYDRDKIIELKYQTRLWVEKNHSRKATGTRILEMLKSIPELQPQLQC